MGKRDMEKPEVGQTLYSLNVGNSARHRKQKLDENESDLICNKIWKAFEYGHNRKNISLEHLRQIDVFLGPE